MIKKENWMIIDIKSQKPLYGVNEKTLVFSSREVAREVAVQLFNKIDEFLLINIPDFNK